jgi:hypothetical protein
VVGVVPFVIDLERARTVLAAIVAARESLACGDLVEAKVILEGAEVDLLAALGVCREDRLEELGVGLAGLMVHASRRPCVLCGREPVVVALYVAEGDGARRLGARSGKTRLVPYTLCDRHQPGQEAAAAVGRSPRRHTLRRSQARTGQVRPAAVRREARGAR